MMAEGARWAAAAWLRGAPARPPRYARMRAIVLRALGAVYILAFASLAVQVDGLIGSRGILPAGEFLRALDRALGAQARPQFPTLFWALGASDAALRGVCWGGVALGTLLVVGVMPGACLALLWLGYLSLTVVGQDFLGFQWDALLLEAGLLALLLAPWGWRLGWDGREPSRVAVWLMRWLVFRLMFLSGVVKLASGDPTWRDWTALRYHYETQPLPSWTSWYAHQLPGSFQAASMGFMYWAELVAPWLIFAPRRPRLVAFASLVLLQGLILATGNFGFFNLLSIVLCLTLVEDRDWGRRDDAPAEGTGLDPAPADSGPEAEPIGPRARRALIGAAAAVALLVTTMDTAEALGLRVRFPWPIEAVRAWVAPLRSFNTYGLFAVMTTERPEILVEGSQDGETWTPYRFRWKPGDPARRPRFATPHMPRLDWQLWFAALAGDCRAQPWFLRFERRLLEGSPPVLGLLREDPFGGRPPRYLRARLFRYHFTGRGARDWWTREEIGLFCPPVGLEADEEPTPAGEPGR